MPPTGQKRTAGENLRHTIKSGDFATYVERELSSNASPGTDTPAPAQLDTSSSAKVRVLAALLALMGATTFAGLGIVAIVTGMASGRSRYTGKEFVLTGGYATVSGLVAIACALALGAFFVQQLPTRIRKGAFLLLAAIVVAALSLAFVRAAG